MLFTVCLLLIAGVCAAVTPAPATGAVPTSDPPQDAPGSTPIETHAQNDPGGPDRSATLDFLVIPESSEAGKRLLLPKNAVTASSPLAVVALPAGSPVEGPFDDLTVGGLIQMIDPSLVVEPFDAATGQMSDGRVSAVPMVTLESASTGVLDGPGSGTGRLTEIVPNPATDEAEIRFVLRDPGDVSLTVHDASGRRVRALTREGVPAGPGSASWDGRDDAGHRAPAGIYFVRLEAGRGVATGKLILLRQGR